jgi:hypothetical protein
MDTAKLPARLHELYPLDYAPLDELPQDGEEDFYQLGKVADRIIQRLEQVRFAIKIFTPSRFLH